MSTPAPDTRAGNDGAAWQHFDHSPGAPYGHRVAVGLIALANDRSSEPELNAFLPDDGVAVWANRVPMPDEVSLETLNAMGDHVTGAAALLLPDDRLDVIAYGCTSGTMAIGAERIAALIGAAHPGVPVSDPITASLDGLRELGARRIALLTPYRLPVNRVVEAYVSAAGFDIVARGSFDVKGDPDICRIPPAAVLEAGRRLGRADVDALFISCTGLQMSSILAELERDIGKPVVSSNQALAWSCLRIADWEHAVAGRGELMTRLGRR